VIRLILVECRRYIGLQLCYIGFDNMKQKCELEQIAKINPSSDQCLKLDMVKKESQVIMKEIVMVNNHT